MKRSAQNEECSIKSLKYHTLILIKKFVQSIQIRKIIHSELIQSLSSLLRVLYMDKISIRGARTHNLRNLSLTIPRNKLVVITGRSGSGKSSLAFDTLYAEGQRRYVESLSSYARQFLSLMDKPDVDSIEGLSPAISIEQKAASHNPRSTVGTVTEIHDYLRLMWARIGLAKCPEHGTVLKAQTVSQMVDAVLQKPEGSKIMILSPIVRGRKGEYKQLFSDLVKDGFIRARIDGEICDLSDPPDLALRENTILIL